MIEREIGAGGQGRDAWRSAVDVHRNQDQVARSGNALFVGYQCPLIEPVSFKAYQKSGLALLTSAFWFGNAPTWPALISV
jgi:hypothetical protein